jgi:hypothetical protein
LRLIGLGPEGLLVCFYLKNLPKNPPSLHGWKMLVDGNYGNLLDQILKGIFLGLPDSMGNENVCELLVLANRVSAKHHNLKTSAIDYIQKHTIEVIKLIY